MEKIWEYIPDDVIGYNFLTDVKQGPNPMNRLVKFQTLHNHPINAVFSKTNSTLAFNPQANINKSNINQIYNFFEIGECMENTTLRLVKP